MKSFNTLRDLVGDGKPPDIDDTEEDDDDDGDEPDLKEGSCFLRHKWTKWDRVVVNVGTPNQRSMQERECVKCGFTQIVEEFV